MSVPGLYAGLYGLMVAIRYLCGVVVPVLERHLERDAETNQPQG